MPRRPSTPQLFVETAHKIDLETAAKFAEVPKTISIEKLSKYIQSQRFTRADEAVRMIREDRDR